MRERVCAARMHCGYRLLTYCITRSAFLHPIEMSWYFEPGFRGYTRLCWVGEKARFLIFLYTSYTFCASGQIPGISSRLDARVPARKSEARGAKNDVPALGSRGAHIACACPRFRSLSVFVRCGRLLSRHCLSIQATLRLTSTPWQPRW